MGKIHMHHPNWVKFFQEDKAFGSLCGLFNSDKEHRYIDPEWATCKACLRSFKQVTPAGSMERSKGIIEIANVGYLDKWGTISEEIEDARVFPKFQMAYKYIDRRMAEKPDQWQWAGVIKIDLEEP